MRITKLLAVLAAVALTLGLGGIASSAATADVPGDVLKIVEVGTDAMGADTYSNRNREFVKFQNVSKVPVDVAGVLVEDNWAHAKTVGKQDHTCNTYKIVDLPSNATTMLAPNEYVTVFNGTRWGGNRKLISGAVVEYQLFANSDRDCGTEGQFFNNNNDAVYVDKDGIVLSSYSWDHNGGYTFKPVGG